MDKNTTSNTGWWATHRPTKRRLIQLYAALLCNAQVKGFVTGQIYTGSAKAMCVPGLNCYSCPGAVGACPLGSLQNALAQSKEHIGFYVFGILALYGLIAGRTICGWVCPLGMIQELLHKIPTPKVRKGYVTRALTLIKYVILATFVVAIPLWYGMAHGMAVPGFCKYLCPAGTLEGAMASLPANSSWFGALGPLFTRKFMIMLIIGLACVFCYRFFCRFLCPLGAIYGMFAHLAVIGVRVDPIRCNGCGTCVRSCGMDVRRVGDLECIHCGACMARCPKKAISIKASNVTLVAPEADAAGAPEPSAKKTGHVRMVWPLVVLVVALVWFNVLDSAVQGQQASQVPASTTTASSAGDMAMGHAVGERLQDFTVTCLDGSTFHLADNLGRPVIINLWATYCAPCVQELPHFEALLDKYEGDVAIIAAHANRVLPSQPVSVYIEDKGWEDWRLSFCVDGDGEEVFGICGASGALPQTVVLDRHGVVVYNDVRSVTPELLERLYEQASAEVSV